MARRDLTGAVDFGRLETYAGGDAALIDEVLELFQEQAQLWTRLLDDEGDGRAFRDAAHTLKGAALGLCADALAEACARAEAQAGAAAARRPAMAAAIRDEVDRVLWDVAAWRHEERLRSLRTPSRS